MNILKKSLMIVIALAFIASAQQEKSKTVETAVAKLQQKVLLSDAQAAQVKSVLNGSNLQDAKSLGSAKAKVESILDARQKAKYSIIKDAWWSGFLKDLNTQSAK